MHILVVVFLIGALLGCNKPNPNPELADPIYLDLNSQAQSVQRELEVAKKTFEGHKKELATVTPQSGAIKYAQKRYFESETKIQILEQKKKYLELKALSRKQYSQREYTKAFKDGKAWPTLEEVEAYKTYQQFVENPKGWDTKKRVREYEAEQEK